MIHSKNLLADLQHKKNSRSTMVMLLEDDLRTRCDADPAVDAPLKAQYEAAKKKKRTALTYKAWREEELTQIAVAWVLGCVFVRFLEDNELVETPKLSGPGARLQRARDEHDMYFRRQPEDDTDRGYLIEIFGEVGRLPGMQEFFDRKHNPLWLAAPSGDACRELLQFWRKTDPATGELLHDFTDPDWNTRFLGDLYQDLSEAARKQYALLQTPDFVEEFILDRTLTPAIQTFGYREVRLIDPTCGSGHFLLGTFARLFRIWQDECPGENPRLLAQRALDGVYGVDLNPFAVAIARFRLLLAALQVCGTKRLKDSPDFQINLAVGDSLIHGARFDAEGKAYTVTRDDMFGGEEAAFKDEMAFFFDTEDSAGLHRILGQQYHAVVGNPPYITVKDKALNLLYRERYDTCHRKYALSVPFMERFFDLALSGSAEERKPAGFTGQITSNSFMKREFGKKLIEEQICRWDLTHVIDASGAYIPGHGTPTVILFGRNTQPTSDVLRTVMGIKGEPATPDEPAKGNVWSAIIDQIDRPGSESEFISSADTERQKFYKHPWSIGGGGASELKLEIDQISEHLLQAKVRTIGFSLILGEDDAFLYPSTSPQLKIMPNAIRKRLISGDDVRDWSYVASQEVLFPYSNQVELVQSSDVLGFLWPLRAVLEGRKDFGKQTYRDCGRPFWEYHQIPVDRNRAPLVITFSDVSTHNHFSLVRGHYAYNRHSPLIHIKDDESENGHLELIGLLNSSVACFWMQQVFHCKGGPGGGSSKDEKWHDFYDIDGTKLKRFPVPVASPLILARELDQLGQKISAHFPDALAARDVVGASAFSEAEHSEASYHSRMISLQEELDWQCYRHYGLIETSDDLEWPEDRLADLPPLTLGERAFEILMARQIAANELETKWFTKLGGRQVTALPAHWPQDYRALVERRLAFIAANKNINLIERPNYKRRWETAPWAKRQQAALKKWLLARLEGYFHGGERVCQPDAESARAARTFTAATRPYLQTANQLADVVQTDARFLEAAEVYVGSSGFSVAKLVRELVEAESVPFLPVHRYKDSGLRKRRDWEETWELQRREDEVEEEVKGLNVEGQTSEEEMKKRVRAAQLERVGEIPVPPKYGSVDFTKATYWKLRGKLDVPKERWISYPGAERAGDDSLLIAWAGWDHLQQAQALAEYFIDARDNQAFTPARLKPLLAGLADLIPWLQQWHNTHDPEYGMGLGDYFAGFLEENCRLLEITVKEADKVRFDKELIIQVPKVRGKAAKVKKSKKKKMDAFTGSWQDAAFVLLAPQRSQLTDYRILVWPELLRQFPGDLPFETLLKAYWLLCEPETLAKRGREILPDVPADWWSRRTESLVKTEFLVTLKGSVKMSWVKIWQEDGERMIRWTGEAPSRYSEAIDDARVALQVAELWEDEVPATEKRKIEAELVEMGF